MSNDLNNALGKLEENNFEFVLLPDIRNDAIWWHLMSPPYNLSLPELSALKNARFYNFGRYKYASDKPIVKYDNWFSKYLENDFYCSLWGCFKLNDDKKNK